MSSEEGFHKLEEGRSVRRPLLFSTARRSQGSSRLLILLPFLSLKPWRATL